MESKKRLEEERKRLDAIDKEMIALFEKRMEISDKVALIKGEGNLSLVDEVRELAVLRRALSLTAPDKKGEAGLFMRSLMALSKLRQRKQLYEGKEACLLPPSRVRPAGSVKIAYQGVPGAWGEQGAIQFLEESERTPCESFEDVFAAVKEKRADYGVVPIENSKTGAIGEVYDLLRKYGCFIVGQSWVQVRHCLMGAPGAALSDIREIFSHPEGFRQCEQYLKNRSWDLTACSNTAIAAKKAAEFMDKRYAAIGSRRAAELNGLSILAADITNDPANQTRFIMIADEPEYDRSCDTVSLIFITAHRSGALCEVLFPFMAGSVNLSRIESRPMFGGKYCFFCDMKGNIMDQTVAAAIRHAEASCGYLEVLGCYHE